MFAMSRSLITALSIALAAPVAATAFSFAAAAQDQPAGAPQEPLKQVALTEKQVQNLLAAQKDIEAIVEKLPDGGSTPPDPKVMAQLDAAAKKYKFASYVEYGTVAGNVDLVMAGIDPQTKKYVGPEVILKQQLAAVQADKQMSEQDRKDATDQLDAALKSVVPVQFPGNIAVVTKYYDQISAAMPQD